MQGGWGVGKEMGGKEGVLNISSQGTAPLCTFPLAKLNLEAALDNGGKSLVPLGPFSGCTKLAQDTYVLRQNIEL